MVVLPICLWVRHERACVGNVLVSQLECVCATNVPVDELRVHKCLSSAIVVMCRCHLYLWLSFAIVLMCQCHFHLWLSFAIVLMCLCHFQLWLSFASVPVICICVCPSVSLHPCPFSLLSGAM